MDGIRRRLVFALGAVAAPIAASGRASAQDTAPPTCRGSVTLGPWEVTRTLGAADNFGRHKAFDAFVTSTPNFDLRITVAFDAGVVTGGDIEIRTKTGIDTTSLALTWPPLPVRARIDGAPIRVLKITVETEAGGSKASYQLDAFLANALLAQMTGGTTLDIGAHVHDPGAANGGGQVSSDIDLAPLHTYASEITSVEEDLKQQLAQEACKVQSGGCFLTTACCIAIGLSDDCYELRRLRAFRDGWLIHQTGGPDQIAAYREIAPRIAASIEASSERNRICRTLYLCYILPALVLETLGLRGAAWRQYARMVEHAEAMTHGGADTAECLQ